MNKRRIRILICAITAFSLFSLTACGYKNNDNIAQNSDPVISEDTKHIEEKTQDETVDKPNHIKEEIEDNLLVDADIIYPEKDSYETYMVEEKNFTQDIVPLFTDDAIKEVSEKPNYPNSVSVDLENGGYLSSKNGNLRYSRTDIEDDNIYCLLSNYIFENGVPEIQNNIAGLNRDEAVNSVKDIFYALNEDNTNDLCVSELQVVPFKSTQMNQMREKELESNDIKKMEINEFTEEDDMYYIRLGINLNGLPIYSGIDEPGMSFAIEMLYHHDIYINAIVDTKGIRYFEYNGVVDLINATESVKTISAQEALDKVVTDYQETILTSKHTISKIYIEYVRAPKMNESGNVSLVPYWVVITTFEDGLQNADRINAITGGNLAYGE